MTISATILTDSVSPMRRRLTTFLLRYPRAIHAELMTHRMLSRNASSSRAIPVKRLIEDVINDPFIPSYWGKNQPGMQAGESWDATVHAYDYLPVFADTAVNKTEELYRRVDLNLSNEQAWLQARDNAVERAQAFDKAGYHKQIVNRLLEPFSHITVVVTATDWANFFWLRNHPDAEPHIHELAHQMKLIYDANEPTLLQPGEWHLPFIEQEDRNRYKGYDPDESIDLLIKVSVARCARTSYRTHDGRKTEPDEDLALYERLVAGQPLHASPAEHQGTPDVIVNNHWMSENLHGNFDGWVQYRKLLPGENFVGH